MHLRFLRKIKPVWVLTLIIGVVIFGGLVDAGVSLIYNQRTEVIKSYNTLAAELEQPLIQPESLTDYSPLTLPSRIRQLADMLPEVARVNALKQEKQKLNDLFDTKVRAYLLDIKPYAEVAGYKPVIHFDSIDFKIKLQPEAYIAARKADFRKQILAHNSKSTVPLRFQFSPAAQVALMSLEAKAGQLFQFGISGQSLSDATRSQLKELRPGGISLFGENIAGPEQLAALTAAMQTTNPEIPLLIGADQEGGAVRRLWWESGQAQSQLAYSAPGVICNVYLERARALKAAGVNWNFGIVADVTSNPVAFIYPRVFAGDYDVAAKATGAATSCTNATLSTLKHWPGHGATSVDTHFQVGTINKGEADWKNSDWKPFVAGIAKGADSIMVGHLIVPWLDAGAPASVCAKCVNYLRESLGYKGLIVTDDMNMLVNAGHSRDDAVQKSLLAGIDIVVINVSDRAAQQQLINLAKQLITSQRITEADLNARLERILTAKTKVIGFTAGFVPADLVY